jgi:DNA-binding NarL/FixJ family response regulator
VNRSAAQAGQGDDGRPSFSPGHSDKEESRRSLRLLVVEDEYLTALNTRYALENEDYEIVDVVGSASDAVVAVEQYQPDLVLMDIRLSGSRDGVDAALEIYRRFGVRCIFATAHADPATRMGAAAARPLGWLIKPYSDRELLQSLERARKEIH